MDPRGRRQVHVRRADGPRPRGSGAIQSASVGSLFWTWLVAVTVSQAAVQSKVECVCATLLFITALVLGHGLLQARAWASGWLPPLVALGAILFLRIPRTTIALSAIGLIGLYLQGYIAGALAAEEAA